jgi:hypothetical protein
MNKNKVIISKKPQPIFQEDNKWNEYAVKQEDVNESILRIIYGMEDVKDVLKHLETEYNYDKRRKHVFFYTNTDIDGLKNYMQYLQYDINSPDILE